MPRLHAFYREGRNGNFRYMEHDYNSKKDFAQDIRRNGLRCIAVLTEEEVQKIMAGNTLEYRYPEDVYLYVKQVIKYDREG